MIYRLSYFEDPAEEDTAERDFSDPTGRISPLEDESALLAANLAAELRSEQFSNISHEFKTPINIILSSMDLLKIKLQSDCPDRYEECYQQYMHYMEQNCYKLLRLVSNLLDSTKVENRSLKLMTSQCELKSFLQNTVQSIATFASKADVELHFNTEIEEPCWLNCDRDRVDRILLNLLSNSIKHMPNGGDIVVTLKQDPDYFYITVTDEGEGIHPDFLPYIFDRFQTCNTSFVKGDEGTGLGLFIVKGLVELHGGVITAESTLGKGASFTFSLSRHLPHSMSEPAVRLPEDEEAKLRSLAMTELGCFTQPSF